MVKVIQLSIAVVYIILHFIVSMFVGILPAAILSLLGMQRQADAILQFNGVLLSKGIIFFLGGVVDVQGLENLPHGEDRICFVSNHQSYVDVPLIVSYVPVLIGFVAKVELRKVPILNGWMKALGCVYIDRSSTRSSVKAIFDGVNAIKSGHPLVIFPEGTRSKSNEFGEFKYGSMKLATRSKAVIVPITIRNTYKLLERIDFSSFRTRIQLIIHEPVPTEGLSDEELKKIPDKVFSIIRQESL